MSAAEPRWRFGNACDTSLAFNKAEFALMLDGAGTVTEVPAARKGKTKLVVELGVLKDMVAARVGSRYFPGPARAVRLGG